MLASLWVVWPQQPSNYLPSGIPWPTRGWIQVQLGDFEFIRKGMTLGLDLQGGVDVILEADLSQQPVGERDRALEGVREILERRVNAFGVTEPVIQIHGENRIGVQLPGVQNVEEAKQLIGQTAQLDFREQLITEQGQQVWVKATAPDATGVEQVLTGAYFTRVGMSSGRANAARTVALAASLQ